MPLEIERRFLIKSMPWEHITHGLHIKQGYLSTDKDSIVRIRLQEAHHSSSMIDVGVSLSKGASNGKADTSMLPDILPAVAKEAQSFITIKGPKHGHSCAEYEYPIPAQDARELLELCGGYCVEKIRYPFTLDGVLWEIDVFLHENNGLSIAEASLEYAEQEFEIPEWIEKEIGNEIRYSNAKLTQTPYTKW